MQYRVGKSYFAHTVNLKLGLVFSRLVYRYIGRFESSYKVSMAYNLGLGPVTNTFVLFLNAASRWQSASISHPIMV